MILKLLLDVTINLLCFLVVTFNFKLNCNFEMVDQTRELTQYFFNPETNDD